MKVFFAYFLVHKKVRSSAKERKGNALASGADEGQAAISFGEVQMTVDPEISEWGNPAEQYSVNLR